MSGNEKREFGDYQTPLDFCQTVCSYIKKHNLLPSIGAILEPTCGIGNFLVTASEFFPCNKIVGIEINESHAAIAGKRLPSAMIETKNIFDVNTRQLCASDNVLIIGNPPWATNANLSYNLPRKNNFKGLRGIDALTGSSNFDICEYIILQLIDEYKDTDSLICMLCKSSVARNVILEMSRNEIAHHTVEMLTFNSNKVFDISAAACVLVIRLSSQGTNKERVVCEVKNIEDETQTDTLLVCNGKIQTARTRINLEGKCPLVWRQGVKHDCGPVMELELKGHDYINKTLSTVHIENDLVYPLVKSSHFKKPILNHFSKYVIVTQSKPKQDTSYIAAKYPLTWKYLNDNLESFTKRKSIIYKNSAPFSMFGIGDYSFAPYKVGLSGFYKKPLFCLLYSDKPVMTDDTAYFLAFEQYDIAYCMMLLLNSKTVQDFLLSIAFLDNKRPYTVKLLSRLDLKKCIDAVSFPELCQTESDLQLSSYITEERYHLLAHYIMKQL